MIVARPMVEFNVTKDRGLFQFNVQGGIENSYTLTVLNKSQDSKAFQVSVSGIEGLSLMGGQYILVGAGDRVDIPVSVSAAPTAIKRIVMDIEFRLNSVSGANEGLVQTSRFTGQPK